MTRTAVWHVFVVLVLLVLLYPVIWLASTSFKPAQEVLSGLALLPQAPTGDNYAQVFAGVGGFSVWHYLGNSLLVSVGAVAGNVISCSLAAYAFARLHFRGRGPMFGFMMGTIMLPQHVVLIPQYVIFQKLGLVDTFWPLVLPKFLATDAFFVFLMVQFIRGLPRELDEAATLDGCGPVGTFRHVVLPLLRPALVTTAIFTFIWTWNDFFSQLIYLTDPHMYTVPVALRSFVDSTSSSSWGSMFAMSVVSLVPVFLAFLLGQRFLIKGIATTGIK